MNEKTNSAWAGGTVLAVAQMLQALRAARPLVYAWPQCRDDLVPLIDAAIAAGDMALGAPIGEAA